MNNTNPYVVRKKGSGGERKPKPYGYQMNTGKTRWATGVFGHISRGWRSTRSTTDVIEYNP